MAKPTYGSEVKKRVSRLLEALLDFVNGDLEDSFKIQYKWEEQDRHHLKLIMKTTLVALESLTGKDKYDGKLTKPQIREALNLLKDYLQILEDNRTKTKGAHEWHFTLTLWSKDKETNLKQFDKAWEDKRPEKSKALAENSQKTDKFDWRPICKKQLEKQKRLTTNQLLSQREDTKHQVDDIHVPIALVERTKPEKRNPETQPHKGSQLYEPSYEEKQRFQHEDFLSQVLETGTGKTQGKRIAVIGEPGAGKTTLLQTIATWILKQNLGFPIWISLADLQGKTLEEYLQRWLKNALEQMEVSPEDKKRFEELFQSGKVWLLLDGVDELGVQNLSPLHWVSSQLEGWVKKARVVLSCRLNVWEANLNALEDFETYRLLNFSYPEQVQQFIQRWFHLTPLPPLRNAERGSQTSPPTPLLQGEGSNNSPPSLAGKGDGGLGHDGEQLESQTSPPTPLLQGEGSQNNSPPSLAGKGDGGLGHDGEQLWNELDKPERQRLQDLVKNPLRLALLCATWLGGDKKLPDTKAGLYHLYVKRFYSWKENCFPSTEQQREELNAALGNLAKRAINQETSRFRLQHQLVREELGDTKFELALRLGWLNKVGLAAESQTQEEVYAFYHPTFEEYFAALAVDNWGYFLTHTLAPDAAPDGVADETDRLSSRPTNKLSAISVTKSVASYRIFEPQWKEVILLWLGREDVKREEKEEFIKALVEFQDGCQHFYGCEAFSIAADGVKEFSECSLRNKILAIVNVGISKINEIRQIDEEIWKKFRLFKFEIYNFGVSINLDFGETWKFWVSLEERLELVSFPVSDIKNLETNPKSIIQKFSGNQNTINSAKFDSERSEDVHTLIKDFSDNPDLSIRRWAIKKLIENAESNPKDFINALIEQRYTKSYQYINRLLCWILECVSVDDSETAISLIKLLETFPDNFINKKVVNKLTINIQDNIRQTIFKRLKEYLINEDYQKKYVLQSHCYKIISHYVQNMSYPEFYQAWHREQDAGKLSLQSQTLRSLDYPDAPFPMTTVQPNLLQTLQTAICNDTQLNQTIHLIYIDTSQFLEPNNPAAEIYLEMVVQGCPKRPQGEPTTMLELKVYWKLFRTVKRVVLLFYSGDTTASHPHGEGFLVALSKFGGAICVIGEKPREDIRLQFFSPSQPVEDVLQWLRGV